MPRSRPTFTEAANFAPPHAWFAVSAVFHYLGPSFAVLLFPSVGVLGVAWMRIAAAAAIFAQRRGGPSPALTERRAGS
jgi:inner membrane transporter RhtA